MSNLVSNLVKNSEYTAFSFTWLKIATIAILGYYLSEMISRIFYFFLDFSDPAIRETVFTPWMIIDTSIYSLAMIFIAIQALIWRDTSRDYETRNKARLAFIMLIITAFLTTLYDVLIILQSDLQHSHQSDNTAQFIFMIIAHFYSLVLIKQLITSIGRSKNTETGTSIFYTLFGLNPAIRYLLWFIILVFSMEYAVIFTYYAELIMVYLTAVVTVGFTIAIWKDARRIKIGYLMASADRDKNLEKEEKEEKEEKKDQDLVITDKTIFVTQEKSEFCKNCGIRIDSKSVKCQKCGHSHTAD